MYEGKDSGIPANIHDIPFFKEQLKQMNLIPCDIIDITIVNKKC